LLEPLEHPNDSGEEFPVGKQVKLWL
jgi:hypothetical protein